MRHAPEDIVDQLRAIAELDGVELPDLAAEDLVEFDAADYIEYLWGYLARIRDGDGDPVDLAREALDHSKWILGR
ncbi:MULTISPECIES: hypothetical protein [unclassified Novosphingobium]|uniref:hypothetical protein n=1 Tax=unclassified Novosphingobium TaxID=2644732 RepID=UPI000D30A227|nr:MULTISPECIES: hypothetical protein [unclassified Novosphingobium]PTR06433.1 hypothetical protein C8K11_12046 [Novosphingobium sp. GV055]PUA94852.1 hypothetical protein C8K12_12046 [Novosphingobium sp. GV061]PUB13777.1 hypothetical protein C8K14_12046 [Novosphingobium sp. GV079]PUB38475.1 hypothetical protein C8K10_12046 [Novosphingobium sp. GV027]